MPIWQAQPPLISGQRLFLAESIMPDFVQIAEFVDSSIIFGIADIREQREWNKIAKYILINMLSLSAK